MWPWEHAALGYLLVSLGLRALNREPPTGAETVVLVAGTQLPDLVDKPLSWGLGWFPSGFAIAHSVFVAIPLGGVALWFGWRSGRKRLAVAATVGYWSHLCGDVLNPLRGGAGPEPARVLWPVAEMSPYDTKYGLERGLVYLREFVGAVPEMSPSTILLYLLVPVAGTGVWLADGAPGIGYLRRAITAGRRRLE